MKRTLAQQLADAIANMAKLAIQRGKHPDLSITVSVGTGGEPDPHRQVLVVEVEDREANTRHVAEHPYRWIDGRPEWENPSRERDEPLT